MNYRAVVSLISVALTAAISHAAVEEVPLSKARRVPPAGVVVPAADRAELEAGLAQLDKHIEALAHAAPKNLQPLLPDVQIFSNAVHYALKYDEFFKPDEIAKGKALLKAGLERAAQLQEGKPAWDKAAGLIVRGYVSKIDGSVQPYGLVIPDSVAADAAKKHRLDFWYHGRGENLSEVNFLSEHMKSPGQFTPADTIVVHPYGRYCNGNRFAGEVDTFEVLRSVKHHYAIDDNRILVRGFSMGGAACWLYATHHAGLWAAAAPGAGFTETQHFLRITDLTTVPWYQQKLWHLYDSTDYALNLFNCPVVAYSGELDGQKQAADEMVRAAGEVGITFPYVIGKGAHHNYTPAAKDELNHQLDAIAAKGRDEFPRHVKFVTYSLRYNTQDWVTVDALDHHWERATVDAEHLEDQTYRITTQNVTALTIHYSNGLASVPAGKPPIVIDNTPIDIKTMQRIAASSFHKQDGKWVAGALPPAGLHKIHGLQGPIDDAFMDSFIIVKPTGKALNEKTAAFTARELEHAVTAWRKQFRGEARVKDDAAITQEDIDRSNLILFGDPSSNAVLAKIAGKLPIHWDAQSVRVGEKAFPADANVPVLIYPNPLNPQRYVVLNSGFTFREYDYENNARQTPKLPDWAIVDITTPQTAQSPGTIPAAGFFGEGWEVQAVK